MIINIPNYKKFKIENLILDFNGSIANSGKVLPFVYDYIVKLSKLYNIYVFTGDTFKTVENQLKKYPLKVIITDETCGIESKYQLMKELDQNKCITIGNGSIDRKMLKYSAIGIVVIGKEGASIKALNSADIIVTSISDAFDMLLNTEKIIATLRE